MPSSIEMTTISYVLNVLHARGQDNEFIFSKKGTADTSDEAIIYLIQTVDGLIGYSLDAYGAYSNHKDDNYGGFIRKMVMKERAEQQLFV